MLLLLLLTNYGLLLFGWRLHVACSAQSMTTNTTVWTTAIELDTLPDDAGSGGVQQPFFENTTQRAVLAAAGHTAKMHCRVRSLSDRAVSWIRKRDLHILTIGVMTYTNDQRFQAQHLDESDEWILRIVSVQPRDSGIYECQVSTEPKISQAFQLTVVVSKAKILASPELFFKSGSDINLTCTAQEAPVPTTYIYWYKDGDLINYSERGGINVLTERLTKTSQLVIARVVPADSGNYTCLPSYSDSDSVLVHVIKSEYPAAMQHERAARLSMPQLQWWWWCFGLLLTSAIRSILIKGTLDGGGGSSNSTRR